MKFAILTLTAIVKGLISLTVVVKVKGLVSLTVVVIVKGLVSMRTNVFMRYIRVDYVCYMYSCPYYILA